MDRSLAIRLLGAPEILAEGQRVEPGASRVIPIVTVLAVAGGRVPRERIASLLWRRVEGSSALSSLRQVLHHLPPPLRSALDADRTSLALDPAQVDCDLWRLRATSDAVALLASYPAPLLEGRRFDEFPEFDDWLRLERAALAGQVRSAALGEMARVGAEEALEMARRWLALEPADEEVHARVMELHLAAGRTASAEAAYEALRRVLATTSGRAPQAATRAILEQALKRQAVPRGAGIIPVSTSFVGRQEELAEIARLAADPHCRLVTLHGPGGVGKTRLAMAFAEEASRHGEVVRYAGLEFAHNEAAMYAALAHALEIEISPRQNPRQRILDSLAAQRAVVILDNFEQLLPAGAQKAPEAALFVAEMLRAAAHLKVIVTSRVALGLQEEWLVPVEGLPYPSAADPGTGAEAAVELFVSRARQAYRGFSGTVERPHILAICRAADGLPLALELAAAQVGTRPCAEIARDLLGDPGARALNRPDRQASVLRVIEQSLAAASAEQARAFAALALFQGTFTAAQAFAVARVGEGVLAELTARALLQRGGEGFRMHPLLRQAGAKRLQRQRTMARRAEENYVAEIARRADAELARLLGRDARASIVTLPARLDDELNALRLAVGHGDPAHVVRLADAVGEAGQHGFSAACLAGWPEPANPHLDNRSRAVLLLRRAMLHGGDIPAALADLESARAALGALDEPVLRYEIDAALANMKVWSGEYREAVALCDGLASVPEENVPLLARVRRVEQLGTALAELGEFERAEALLDAGIAMLREIDASSWLLSHVLNPRGGVAQYRGDLERCVTLHREALALLEADGFGNMCAPHHCNIGGALLEMGALDQAEAAFTRAVEIATHFGARGPLAYSLVGLANVAFGRRDEAGTDRHAGEARALARRIGSSALEAEATTLLVRSRIRRGNLDHARAMLEEQERETRDQDLGFRRLDVAYSALQLAALDAAPPDRTELASAAAALLAAPTCTSGIRADIERWKEVHGIPRQEPAPLRDPETLFALLAPRSVV